MARLGVPIRQVRLPRSLGPGGDLRDFLNKHGAEALELLADSTLTVHPEPEVAEVVGFAKYLASGAQIERALQQPASVSPIPSLLDPDPHLHVLVGRPKEGKTTFALYIALAWANGVAPWLGTRPLPRGRVLVVSNEQPLVRLATVLKRLSEKRHKPLPERSRFKNLYVLAKDQSEPQVRRALQLGDEHGLPALKATLAEARDQGRPFGLLILDSLSRLKPADIDENDNDAMTEWLDKLESIALESGVYVILIHHAGHAGREDARAAPRGASAIGAVPAGLWWLKRTNNARHRLVRVAGWMLQDQTLEFAVCKPDAPESNIDFFRRESPAERMNPENYIKPGEELKATELDARILDIPGGSKTELKGLSRQRRQQARAVRRDWQDHGLVTVERRGAAHIYRLADKAAAEGGEP